MQVEVRFHPSGRRLRVPEGTSLLEAARRAGLPLASACGADGVCGRCAVQVLAGGDSLSAEGEYEAHVKRMNRVAPALRLACRAGINGPVEVSADYW